MSIEQVLRVLGQDMKPRVGDRVVCVHHGQPPYPWLLGAKGTVRMVKVAGELDTGVEWDQPISEYSKDGIQAGHNLDDFILPKDSHNGWFVREEWLRVLYTEEAS